MKLLDGVRVLDMGRYHAGPYCAKLFADAGADVIHVEHPAGDPTRHSGPFAPEDTEHQFSAGFVFLNAGKGSVTLDYTTGDGEALLWEFVGNSDILIENFAPGTLERHGFTMDALLARNPGLVRVSITNYGLSGPYRDLPATEMTLQAASGLMDGNGSFEREPLRYPMNLAQHWAGANAAYAAMVAYWHALMTGEGQQVDVSIQESLADTWFMVYANYEYTGILGARGQSDLLPASDGKLMMRWQTSVPWEEFAIAFDAMELVVDPELRPPAIYGAQADRIAAILSAHSVTRTRREWMDRAIAHEVPAGMLQTLEEILNCEQHAARAFWNTVKTPSGQEASLAGRYYLLNDEARQPTVLRVPRLGEHNAEVLEGLSNSRSPDKSSDRPSGADEGDSAPAAGGGRQTRRALEGIRIVDNGIVQAGTFPARLLADFGAEVVRVENYLSPDLSRNGVFPDGMPSDPYWENGGTYHEQHRNKRFCIGLDVRKPEGREAFLRLAKISDIVLDSHPPGVMDKLNLNYAAIKAVKPDIIFISTSGYGYHGPYAGVRSYGMMSELMAGFGWLNGYAGEGPRRGSAPLTDHPATYHGAFMLLAALVRRRRTGEGCWIDMSQYEIGTALLGDAMLATSIGAPVPVRVGSVDPGASFSGCFRCDGDDRWVAVTATTETAGNALAAMAGLPGLERGNAWFSEADHTIRERLAVAVSNWTAARSPEEACRQLSAAGIAASPVNTVRDLLLDPHLAERGFFWLIEQAPEQHAGRRAWPGASAKLSSTPGELRHRAPMLGEHNRSVATELLGYTDADYDAAELLGAFGTVPRAAAVKPPPTDFQALLARRMTALGGAKLVDWAHLERMQGRFGGEYGMALTKSDPAAGRR